VAFALKLEGDLNKQAQKLAKQLYEAFLAYDCAMLEINPLVETEDGNLLVLDTKMSFDSNAMYRQKAVEELRDVTEEDEAEVEASEYDLAYIKLDGNIGCMVNGAGLAMAGLAMLHARTRGMAVRAGILVLAYVAILVISPLILVSITAGMFGAGRHFPLSPSGPNKSDLNRTH